MNHYSTLIHKDSSSGYGISFPGVLGVTATADTLDDALREAAIALAFEDWPAGRPTPRTLDALRQDRSFLGWSADAVVTAAAPAATADPA